ncbi:MAG: tetratricopeptide repeat protein [Thermoanaerobaculia bacterium]
MRNSGFSKTTRTLLLLGATLLLCAAFAEASAPRNLGRAIEVQRALVLSRPADSAAENDLGSLLVLAGDNTGAEAAYRRAIEIDSANGAAHFNLGLLLQKLEDRRGALKEFKRTLSSEPRNAWAHYQIGTIYDHWGLDSAAKRAYARAIAIDPNLGNPAVNPHLLDNELATSAMLYSYHHYREELLPEKRFEEPARIAGVLIDRPHSDANVDAVAATEGESSEGGGFIRPSGTAAATSDESAGIEKPEPDDGDSTAARVLSTKDLDPASVSNQVGGGTTVVGVGGARSGSSLRARTRDTRTGSAPLLRPQLRSQPAPTPTFPSSPTTFVPTGDSTGRMETRLVEIDAAG